MEAQAFGNLGIARLNMGHYEDAIGYLEQQLATLEQLSSATAVIDKGRALGNLGDCYDALGDYDEAIKCHEQVHSHINIYIFLLVTTVTFQQCHFKERKLYYHLLTKMSNILQPCIHLLK